MVMLAVVSSVRALAVEEGTIGLTKAAVSSKIVASFGNAKDAKASIGQVNEVAFNRQLCQGCLGLIELEQMIEFARLEDASAKAGCKMNCGQRQDHCMEAWMQMCEYTRLDLQILQSAVAATVCY